MYKFDPLIPDKYDLSPIETLAYQCCIVYLTLAHKIFPNYRHCKLPKSGNVRNASLFKHCLKMCKNLDTKVKKDLATKALLMITTNYSNSLSETYIKFLLNVIILRI